MNYKVQIGSMMLTLATAGLVRATDVQAQACKGIPSADGQISLQGTARFSADAIEYGGSVNADLIGPISIGGGYTRTDFDDSRIRLFVIGRSENTLFTEVAYEISGLGLSVCAMSGLRYGWGSEEPIRRLAGPTTPVLISLRKLSRLVIPVGVGIGRFFQTGTKLSLTVFAEPQVLYVREKTKIRVLDPILGSVEESPFAVNDTDAEFVGVAGFLIGTARIFGGGSLGVNTLEEADVSVAVLLGVIF